jgi:anti-sigma-K factor RskA
MDEKKTHPNSLPATGAQSWSQLRAMEAQSRRARNWRVAVVVVAVVVVYALAAHFGWR